MLVSVIVVSYNSSPLLIECVLSALAVSVPVEVIVSDNGSTDCSVEPLEDLAKMDRRLYVHRNGANLGFAGGNNVVLPMATGDFVLFLNPDCILKPETIAQLLKALDAHPEAGMAGCVIRNADGSEEMSGRRRVPTAARLFETLLDGRTKSEEPLPSKSIVVEAISGAFMMVRRDELDRIGSFDTDYFMHWEDLDLCRRFQQAGRKILFVPGVEVRHFKGRSSQRRPLRVEWYKHRGLMRYLLKFDFAGWRAIFYPPVVAAIALRFLMRAVGLPSGSAAAVNGTTEAFAAQGQREIWVFGATSLIGRHLVPRLVAAGYFVRAFSRKPAAAGPSNSPHLTWHILDLADASGLPSIGTPELVIHLAPLFSLSPVLPRLCERGLRSLIAFSSTSVFTKRESDIDSERQLTSRLTAAEDEIRGSSIAGGVRWVILRPTMIYSLGYDRNVTRLARFIRWFRFFPLPGQGCGLRQPVHADDLAKACVSLLSAPDAWNQSYNLSGGETLSYRVLVEALFRQFGQQPRFLRLPDAVWRMAIRLARHLPGGRDLNMAMIHRADIDLCFPHDEATRAFAYAPRPFQS